MDGRTPLDKGSVTLVWVVACLALHAIWRQTVFHPYSFVILRVFFLLALLVFLAWRGQPGEMRQYFLGRLVPAKESGWVAVGIVLLVIVARVAVEWFRPSTPDALTLPTVVDNCLIAPVNEELVFRGVFLTLLRQHLPQKTALSLLLSALIFTGSHNLSDVTHILPLMTGGLVYGYAFARTGSLPFSIACHMLWNAFGFVPFGWNH